VPIDLHERLSEFSYGYGVTREVERLLRSVGLRPTPFLPSLLEEAKLGFDVAFERLGAALLLQFKLGEALQRFVHADKSKPPPALVRPFWRFSIDTAEPDGQYDLLLKAEQAGEEVYYVAPRFANWNRYVEMFQNAQVLEQSLLIRPSQIEFKLARRGEPDGWHKVIYDQYSVHVCSEAERIEEVRASELAANIRSYIQHRSETMEAALRHVYTSLSRRREIRLEERAEPSDIVRLEMMRPAPDLIMADRSRRLESLHARAATEGDALFAAIGLEAWAVGTQLLAVTLSP
jgi:hypothetical protein